MKVWNPAMMDTPAWQALVEKIQHSALTGTALVLTPTESFYVSQFIYAMTRPASPHMNTLRQFYAAIDSAGGHETINTHTFAGSPEEAKVLAEAFVAKRGGAVARIAKCEIREIE